MRIVYLAQHRPGDWDEGASISYALTQLGHTVIRVPESEARNTLFEQEGDFLLFHHYGDLLHLEQLKIPKVCWYFDLVDWPDPSLVKRCQARIHWIQRATELCAAVFLSDGDWYARANSPKLHLLNEGADARYCGKGVQRDPDIPVLFVGSPGGGVGRQGCLNILQGRYSSGFMMAGTNPRSYIWTRPLANLVARAKVVFCPDSPVTDRYWSNRCCVMTGFGGFVVHAESAGLRQHYTDDEVVFYKNREHMTELIDRYLDDEPARRRISTAGMMRTMSEHTSLHRCAKLIKTLEGIL